MALPLQELSYVIACGACQLGGDTVTDVPSWRYDWRKAVNRDYRLTHSERRVLFELDSAANPDGTNARPGNTLIAENLRMSAEKGMNEKSVRRALDRGVELGYIAQTAKARRVSESVWLAAVWRLIPPASVDTQLSGNESRPLDTQMSSGDQGSADISESSADISESSVDISESISGHSESHQWTSRCPDTRSLTPDHSHQSTNTSAVTPASTSRKRSRAPKRGTRISEDFQPRQEDVEWAESNHPSVNLSIETEKFRNYWKARAKNATKLDWNATWRNWVINESGYAAERRSRSTARPTDPWAGGPEGIARGFFGASSDAHAIETNTHAFTIIDGDIA
ncbi:hypothetical protein [Rhodococcus rhodochrous]|uniref:hypothetical protein n=1 Tax=Rhodococcus rhodochrous TaxID=1829 RepID=UPI0012FD6322|nr:hypothetical protein [Rhodococcus rhodochrous]